MSSMEVNSEIKGLVFSIDRNVVEDGPGLRTTIFFKGCPLRCVWCHSPQSQSKEKQLLFIKNRCIGCGECFSACPGNALAESEFENLILWDNCNNCGECAKICPSMALEMSGKWLTVDQVMDNVHRDAVYFRKSGGGVTFSGGEATFQPDFLYQCLTGCKESGIHTAVDTSGFAKWPVFEKIIPYTDLFLYDLKCMDPGKHEAFTGISNELIIDNLRRIDEMGKSTWIRIPLIPGFTNVENDLKQTAEFIATLKHVEKVSLLPYNGASGAKYTFIGKKYELEHIDISLNKDDKALLGIFSSSGVDVEYGR
jgi:pyruvate formate lyase activating enzyme